ncbi:MAG: Ig-like domain-containing protein [Bacillota bacterium]|nr:Ig-like domain-containing protein [Bacillota bacterium]
MKARNKRYAAILSVVTVLALALSLVAVPMPTFAASTVKQSAFSDVKPTDPYANAFNALAAVGVYQGDQNGNANPTQQITRAEFAAVAVRLAGKAAVADSLQNQTPAFKDANSIPNWAWGAVNAAAALGIIKGYPDGTFRATNNVTEAEAATMIIRVLGNDGAAQTGLWPANYMAVAQQLGLLNGITNAAANVPATRADVAFMAYNALVTNLKWDAATSSFDKDYAGLSIYYTNPTTGEPKQRDKSQLTTYGEWLGVMAEDPSWPSKNLNVAGTVYLATATDVSAVQNQDVYVFRPFGASAYTTIVPSGQTSVVSGTVSGFSASTTTRNGYISLGGKLYPVTSDTTYSVNGTPVTQDELQRLPKGFTSGAYSATVTLDSNGNAANVAVTRYNLSGFLTQATPAASSPDTLDEIRVATFDSATPGTGTYDVTGATLLLDGQSAAVADIQKALSDFSSAHSGQPISVKIETPYNTSTHAFDVAGPSTRGTAVAVKVSTKTVSGQVTAFGSDSSGTYVQLSGQDNAIYIANSNLGSSDFRVGANVTVLLDASGNAVAVLQTSAQQTDFYAILSKINTTSSSSGGTTTTITVTMGDGSAATYTLRSGVSVDQGLVGEPVYVTVGSDGYVSSVASYNNAFVPVSGTVSQVTSSYVQLQGLSPYVISGTPLIFDAADTSFANQLPLASVVKGQKAELYLNSKGQVGLIILSTVQVSSLTLNSGSSLTLNQGSTYQLQVTATVGGTTQDVTDISGYNSSNPVVATVSPTGLVTAQQPGVARITVSYRGSVAMVDVTVPGVTGLAVEGPDGNTHDATHPYQMTTGDTAQLSVLAVPGYADLTPYASYSSSDESVATVNQAGLVTAVGAGTAQITVRYNGQQAAFTVSVSAPVTLNSISVTPSSPVSLTTGATLQLKVTANLSDSTTPDVTDSASYSSNDTSVATVSNTGLVTATGPGVATITVSYGGKQQTLQVQVDLDKLQSITVQPSSATLSAGAQLQLKVTAKFADNVTKDVTGVAAYASSDSSVATVTPSGLVTAKATGNATITVTYGGQNGTAAIIVP